MAVCEYKYTVEMELNDGTKGTVIPIENIANLLLKFEYATKSMPFIVATLAVGKQLLNKIKLEKINSTIILTIKKFKVEGNVFLEDYIKDEFLYYIIDDIAYTTPYEYQTDDDKDRDDVTQTCRIGLTSLRLSNSNKKLFNNVYKDISNKSLALIALDGVENVVFDDTIQDFKYDYFLLPPIDNRKDLLEYINNRHCLYDTDYRYFMDFNETYLLSNSTDGVETEDEPNNNILFNIFESNSAPGYFEGQSIDESKKTYAIPVCSENTNMYPNNSNEKRFNILTGISSSGEKDSTEVSINKSSRSNDREKLVRVPYENFDMLNVMANAISNECYTLTLSKYNIDFTVITPNKHITVKNNENYSDLDGEFILTSKNVILQHQSECFVSVTSIDLRSHSKV